MPTTARALALRFARDENGATAIEYGLIAALMAMACIAAFAKLGGNSAGSWGSTATKISNVM